MGELRFSEVDGLPNRALTGKRPPSSEAEKVRVLRAKWQAAKRVVARRRATTNVNREMLAGRSPFPTVSQDVPHADSISAPPEVVPTNLFLRATLQAKSEACDESWTTRCHGIGDLPRQLSDAIVTEAETLIEKVFALGEVTEEFSDSIDDSATIGPMIVKHGVGRGIVERASLSGGSQEFSELIFAAANGDQNVHPLPGMDFPELAKAARGFVTPESFVLHTVEQLENLERLAQEAEQMWVDAIDQAPEGYRTTDVWYRRVVFGDDVLWDPTVTTRWKDARWMGFLIRVPLAEAKKDPSFKPSARAQLKPVKAAQGDGHERFASPEIDPLVESLNEWCVLVEWWDRDTGEVHYFTEEAYGYEGFLERDSLYPYFDAKMRSILKNWFPVAVAVPVKNNLPVPERTQGMGWLEPGRPHAKLYVAADSALTASRKKCGRVIVVPEDFPADKEAALTGGEDLVVLRHGFSTSTTGEKMPYTVLDFGEAPVDLFRMRDDALKAFSASVGLTLPEASGEAVAPTLGQERMATSGPSARRSGLIRKMQAMAGDIAQDSASYVRNYYSKDKATQLMGSDFTTATPYTQDGVAVKDEKGEPVMVPSKWDIWKNASTPWDQWEVVFNPTSQSEDWMRAKAAGDFSAQLQTAIDPVTRVPYFDIRPLLEKQSKALGFGRLKPFPITPEQAAVLLGVGQQQPDGGPSGHETPGGGRSDSRTAHGQRGSQPVPGRQDRNESPGDDGDMSVRAHRVGTA